MSAMLQFLRDESGPTAVEYAVLLALILGSIIAAIGAVGAGTGNMWGGIETELGATPFGS
jgi:pilus assembly protein Flp/PilA